MYIKVQHFIFLIFQQKKLDILGHVEVGTPIVRGAYQKIYPNEYIALSYFRICRYQVLRNIS